MRRTRLVLLLFVLVGIFLLRYPQVAFADSCPTSEDCSLACADTSYCWGYCECQWCHCLQTCTVYCPGDQAGYDQCFNHCLYDVWEPCEFNCE